MFNRKMIQFHSCDMFQTSLFAVCAGTNRNHGNVLRIQLVGKKVKIVLRPMLLAAHDEHLGVPFGFKTPSVTLQNGPPRNKAGEKTRQIQRFPKNDATLHVVHHIDAVGDGGLQEVSWRGL
jgi:hypothetical protein